MKIFQTADDYTMYLALLQEDTAEHGVAISADCLMPNHSHLIATPSTEEALAKAIGNTHRRFTRYVNMREFARVAEG